MIDRKAGQVRTRCVKSKDALHVAVSVAWTAEFDSTVYADKASAYYILGLSRRTLKRYRRTEKGTTYCKLNSTMRPPGQEQPSAERL